MVPVSFVKGTARIHTHQMRYTPPCPPDNITAVFVACDQEVSYVFQRKKEYLFPLSHRSAQQPY